MTGKQRFYWYSNERAPMGRGPFGPLEARTVAEAYEVAAVRAKYAGLTLRYCIAAYRVEYEEDRP